MLVSIKAYLGGRHMSVAKADTILARTTTTRKEQKSDRGWSSRGTNDSVKSFETLSSSILSPESPTGSVQNIKRLERSQSWGWSQSSKPQWRPRSFAMRIRRSRLLDLPGSNLLGSLFCTLLSDCQRSTVLFLSSLLRRHAPSI